MSRRQNKALGLLLDADAGWEITLRAENGLLHYYAKNIKGVEHRGYAPTLGEAMRDLLHKAMPDTNAKKSNDSHR